MGLSRDHQHLMVGYHGLCLLHEIGSFSVQPCQLWSLTEQP